MQNTINLINDRKVVELRLLVFTIVTGCITRSVPAAIYVNVGRSRLRVDDDDVVQFSDLVVASVLNKFVSHNPPRRTEKKALQLKNATTR